VAKAKIGPFITALSDAQMDRVQSALLFALGLGFREHWNVKPG
jgi:hypothetical protein